MESYDNVNIVPFLLVDMPASSQSTCEGHTYLRFWRRRGKSTPVTTYVSNTISFIMGTSTNTPKVHIIMNHLLPIKSDVNIKPIVNMLFHSGYTYLLRIRLCSLESIEMDRTNSFE